MSMFRPGHVVGQRHQGRRHVDGVVAADLADRLADVAEQQPRQGMRLPDVLVRLALGQVAGHLEVQAQRGQVVAQQVVQFARDAGALVDPGAFGQQRAGGAQLGIQAALLVARLRLLAGDHAGDEHESGQADVQHRLHQGLEPGEPQRAHVDRHHHQLAQHKHGDADRQRQQPGQHAGHHHQQDAAQAAGAVVADRDGAAGQQHQQQVVERTGAARIQRAGEPAVAEAEGRPGQPGLPAQRDRGHGHVVALVAPACDSNSSGSPPRPR